MLPFAMNTGEFRDWIEALGFSQVGAAAALYLSLRTIQLYEAGQAISQTIVVSWNIYGAMKSKLRDVFAGLAMASFAGAFTSVALAAEVGQTFDTAGLNKLAADESLHVMASGNRLFKDNSLPNGTGHQAALFLLSEQGIALVVETDAPLGKPFKKAVVIYKSVSNRYNDSHEAGIPASALVKSSKEEVSKFCSNFKAVDTGCVDHNAMLTDFNSRHIRVMFQGQLVSTDDSLSDARITLVSDPDDGTGELSLTSSAGGYIPAQLFSDLTFSKNAMDMISRLPKESKID